MNSEAFGMDLQLKYVYLNSGLFFYLERIEVEQVVSWSEKIDEKVSMERGQLKNGIFGCYI